MYANKYTSLWTLGSISEVAELAYEDICRNFQ